MGNGLKKSSSKRKAKSRKSVRKTSASLQLFNWYLVKQQLDLARVIGSFSAAKSLDIKEKILAELRKLDGIEVAKISFSQGGVSRFNENLFAVICSTCFSPAEQEEIVFLLLKTNEMVTLDDLYCSLFETSSPRVVCSIIDKVCENEKSKTSSIYESARYGLEKGHPGEYSILDVFLYRFKLLMPLINYELGKSLQMNRICTFLYDYQTVFFKLIHEGFKICRVDQLEEEMHNLETPTIYHASVFHLLLFVNKQEIVKSGNNKQYDVDSLVRLDNHLCELTLKRMQRIEVDDELAWRRLYAFFSAASKINMDPKEEETCLQPFKASFYQQLYTHIKMSPVSGHLTQANRDLLTRLMIENRASFQPLSLMDLCRLKVISSQQRIINFLPNKMKRFLNYEDEIVQHFYQFLLI